MIDTKNDGDTARPDWNFLWDNSKLDDSALAEVDLWCKKILANQKRYTEVALRSGVPWYLIAALHYREASCNFSTCLHNGDPLPGPTKHVPKNRGPFKTWEDAALDALKYDGLSHLTLLNVYACLVAAERFNGVGYRKKGEYTPYVWAGTNWSDETGKYVADGKFDPKAKEKQLGVAAIFLGIKARGILL